MAWSDITGCAIRQFAELTTSNAGGSKQFLVNNELFVLTSALVQGTVIDGTYYYTASVTRVSDSSTTQMTLPGTVLVATTG